MRAMRVYKFLPANFGLKSLYERRLKVSTFDDLNDPLDLFPYSVRKWKIRKKINKLTRDLTAQHGMLCFSAAWNDPVIWAHYSDKHRGICLGFNVPDDRLTRVKYVKDRLSPSKDTFSLADLVGTKYMNWAYEEESRMLLLLKEAEDGIYYHDFGHDLKLAEVIAGHRCTTPRVGVERALGDLKGHVKLIKARVGFGRFEVREKDSGWE
jgi:hypothetical protein